MREIARILFWGDPAGGRRVRMCAKVIAELRRRGRRCTAVSYGAVGNEATKLAVTDEIHEGLTADELANLFHTASIVLEPADREELLSPAGRLGMLAGIPTISHRDAAVRGSIVVDEWSADAFADAISSIHRVASPRRVSYEKALIDEFEKALLGKV